MAMVTSLKGRAAIAVALTIGFYLMAILIGLGAMCVPILLSYVMHQILIKLIILGIITGGAILVSIIPRKDNFVAPGPLLLPQDHPKLFKVIEGVAKETNQEMPKEIYAIPAFNAWVAQRGGLGIFGGERIMAIGLPLAATITVAQFKAIIAHEFGHFCHGDTKLGPWIYRTRSAISRTFTELEDRGSFLKLPFKWYGLFFLKITQAISRNQEYIADQVAANIVGKDTMIEMLKLTAAYAVAYDSYWGIEFGPALGAGYLLPFLDGFREFLSGKDMGLHIDSYIAENMEKGKAGDYDTHPSLAERVAAVSRLSCENKNTDASLAIDLFAQLHDLENILLKEMIREDIFPKLKPITCDKTIELIFEPNWKRLFEKHREFLNAITFDLLPDIAVDVPTWFKTFIGKRPIEGICANDELMEMSVTIAAGLIVTLQDCGWSFHGSFGNEIKLSKDDAVIEPFSLLYKFEEKRITKDEWISFCKKHELYDVSIANLDPVETQNGRVT